MKLFSMSETDPELLNRFLQMNERDAMSFLE